MAYVEAGYGGTYGGSYRLWMQVDQTSQNYGGNYSTVHIVVGMKRVSSSGGDIWNNSATGWSANVDGQGYSGSIVQGHLGNGGNIMMLDTYKNIGHNGDGTRSFGFSASHDSGNSPYQTSAGTSGSMGLTTIPRYANITGFSVTNVTDTSFNINISTDANCDYFSYWLNGGTHHDTASSGTSKTFTITDLPSNTTYTVQGAARRADSGQWTNTTTTSTTTLTQNKFFDFGDI